jgi:glycosyltransferase involved in cell wall biosynthesis
MRIETSPLQRLPGVHRYYRHLLPVMPWAAACWSPGEVDLVISLSHCVAKSVSVPAGVPHICYCFTPMRYAWDGRDAYLAGWERQPFRRAIAENLLDRLREWDRATARGVTHFVAISRTIQERIWRSYGRESLVIPPPVNTDFYTPGQDSADRTNTYLCVSALVPYKRIDHAVEACARLGRRLTVIGEGPERRRLESLAVPNVRFLGWQADEVIRDELRRCRALLFPGEEDFGIVPIEALACGTPVIALGRGGVAETVDDRVGRLYQEASSEGLAAAILEWEEAGAHHDTGLARRRAEGLATSAFERRMLELVRDVAVPRVRAEAAQGPHAGRARTGRTRPNRRAQSRESV